MKKILILFVLLCTSLFSKEITNSTTEPMLCIANYPVQYAKQKVNNILQRVQTQESSYVEMVLEPKKSFNVTKKGSVSCYNELQKISYSANDAIITINDRQMKHFLKEQERYNLLSYVDEDKLYIESKYGKLTACANDKKGEYCQLNNQLDILFNQEGRIQKLYIYGNAFNNRQKQTLLAKDALNKININSEKIGLWLQKKNSVLTKKKPLITMDNVIIWKSPTPRVRSLSIIAKYGHKMVQRSYRKKEQTSTLREDAIGAIEIEYVLDDESYKNHIKTRVLTPTRNSRNPTQKRFPYKAKTTWGRYLNPKDSIPKNSFKAFYINTNNPKKVIASETVKQASVNYVSSRFHKIKSEDFGAYWVGKFTYEKEMTMHFIISQGWSKTRIIVDGMVIYEGEHEGNVDFTFKKGTHKIEVEYINNWHTTDFLLSIKAKIKQYSIEDAKKLIHQYPKAKMMYAGAYESKNKDQTITLQLAKSKDPILLVLGSARSINWIIKNPHNVKIAGIIYNANNRGGDIKGEFPEKTKVLAVKAHFSYYTLESSCSCHGMTFHCENQAGLKTITNLEYLFGKKVFGWSAKYSAATLLVPSQLITSTRRTKLAEEEALLTKQQTTCNKKSHPDFERIFE